jgi:hypothetical protein
MRARRTATASAVVLTVITCLFAGAGTAAAQGVDLHARLILASNDPAPQDPRLEDLEFKLRRVFGFEYYELLGKGGGMVDLPGQTSISLGNDCVLNIAAESAGGGRVRASVQWMRGRTTVLNTTVVVARGAGVILGGVSHKRGTLLVALDAR